jgi:hypothetical protein
MTLVRQQTTYFPNGLGDVGGDLSALVSLASAAGSTGGIAAWMQQQIAQFNALPQTVQNLQAILQTLSTAFTAAGVTPAGVQGFSQAQSDLSEISAQYPATQAALGTLGVTLYPALAAGTFSLATITTLSAQGLDVLGTFNGMQTLFGYEADAKTQIQAIASNPALPAATQQQVLQALANIALPSNATTVTGYLIVAGVAYVGWRLFRKVF